MFRLGWRVFRERLPELVSPRRRRRVAVVGVVVAVVALVGLVLLGAVSGEADAPSGPVASALVGAVLLAGGLGLVAACFVPIGPKGWGVPPIPGIGWRTQEAIGRYYRRNPPPVEPAHRDAVLDGMSATRDLLVRSTFRGYLLLGGWASGLLGAVLVDLSTTAASSDSVFGVWPFWLLLPLSGAASAVGGTRTLGRQEQLRVEAEALPPVPPPVRRGRPDSAVGSKLGLPGE